MTVNFAPSYVKTANIGDVSVSIDQIGTANGVQIVAALPAGTAIVGKFGIDQTVQGTTNGVVLNTGANSIGTVGLNAGANSIGLVGLNAGSNLVGKFGIDQTAQGTTNAVSDQGIYNSSAPTLTSGNYSPIQLDVNGNLKTNIATALPSGTNLLGKVSIDQVTSGANNVQITGVGTSSGNPLYVNTGAGNSGTVKNSGALNNGGVDIPLTLSATLMGTAITTSKVASLEHITVASPVSVRWDIQSVSNTNTAVTAYTFFTGAQMPTYTWSAMPGGEFTLPSADGTNAKFQIVATNVDPNFTASVSATFAWIEN